MVQFAAPMVLEMALNHYGRRSEQTYLGVHRLEARDNWRIRCDANSAQHYYEIHLDTLSNHFLLKGVEHLYAVQNHNLAVGRIIDLGDLRRLGLERSSVVVLPLAELSTTSHSLMAIGS
jgi:hypothetical protein